MKTSGVKKGELIGTTIDVYKTKMNYNQNKKTSFVFIFVKFIRKILGGYF